MNFSQQWLESVKAKHLQASTPGEDLRYDENFTQLKAQNGAVSPDALWMIQKSAELLEKSADLRVCMYALHATAILGEADGFIHIMDLYADLISLKFHGCYPEGINQKLGTFEWCLKSFIVNLLKSHEEKFSADHLSRIKHSLIRIHEGFEKQTGEIIKWRTLLDWIETQSSPQQSSDTLKQQRNDVNLNIETSKDIKPHFDEWVDMLMKEGQYERAVGLARAYRWADLKAPQHTNRKTNLEIRQSAIDQIKSLITEGCWKEVLFAAESLFMEPHAQFFMTLNHWSHEALMNLGYPSAAECILLFVKKLYKNDGQLFRLMYNGGQSFCESETLRWIEQQSQEKPFNSGTCQNDVMQLIKEQDVEKMKAWLSEHPIKTKKEVFARDLMHLKLNKLECSDSFLTHAADSLFERSIDEDLHDWEPDLAHSIWIFYAGFLKEEKQQHNNNQIAKNIWQAKWDRFSNKIARSHLPAALEIMKYI